MTPQESARLVGVLRAAHTARKVEPETVKVYAMMLADLDHELAERAVARCLKTIPYWPSIADIRTAYRAVQREREANMIRALPEATEGQMEENIRRVHALTEAIGIRIPPLVEGLPT